MNLYKVKKLKKFIKEYSLVFMVIVGLELILIGFFVLPVIFKTPVFLLLIKSDSMYPVIKTGESVLVNGYSKNNLNNLLDQPVAFFDPTKNKVRSIFWVKQSLNRNMTK